MIKERVIGPVYLIMCEDCGESYIGVTERSLKDRFQEHRLPSTSTSEVLRHLHSETPSHLVSLDKVKILDVDPRWFERGVKEAIHIRISKPELNRGRYQLPSVWDNLLTKRVGGGDGASDPH